MVLVTCYRKSGDSGGLAPQILVGFFFKAPKKNCCKNEIAELKKKKKKGN
jgi:hypothetical protein